MTPALRQICSNTSDTSSQMVVPCLYQLIFPNFDSAARPPTLPPASRPASDNVKFFRYYKHFNCPVHSMPCGVEIIAYIAQSASFSEATYRMSKFLCTFGNYIDQVISDVRLSDRPPTDHTRMRPSVHLAARPLAHPTARPTDQGL